MRSISSLIYTVTKVEHSTTCSYKVDNTVLGLSIATLLVSLVALVVAIISFKYTIMEKRKNSKNKELNFLYKRLREFKRYLNACSQKINMQNDDLWFHPQQITDCQVYFSDTVLTSKILGHSFSLEKNWNKLEYNNKVSNVLIDKINDFGSKLWEIDHLRTPQMQLNTQDFTHPLTHKFENLIKNFVYRDFYVIIQELVEEIPNSHTPINSEL